MYNSRDNLEGLFEMIGLIKKKRYRILSKFPVVVFLTALCAYMFCYGGAGYIRLPAPFDFVQNIVQCIEQYLICALIIALILDIATKGITLARLIFCIIGFLCVQYVSTAVDDDKLLYFFWFVAAYPRDCSLRYVARCIWVTGFFTMVAVFLCNILGFIPGVMDYGHGALRHSFGFGSPNNVSVLGTCYIIAALYDLSHDWHWSYVPEILCLAVLLFYIGNGRMSLLLAVVAVAFVCLVNWKKLPRVGTRIIFIVAKWAVPCCAFLSLFMSFIWEKFPYSAGFTFFNVLFSTRPAEMVDFLREYGFSIFPQNIILVSPQVTDAPGVSPVLLDNSYMYYALLYGLILFIAIVWLFYMSGSAIEQKGDVILAFFLILLALFCLSEKMLVMVNYNLIILVIGAFLSGSWDSIRIRNTDVRKVSKLKSA